VAGDTLVELGGLWGIRRAFSQRQPGAKVQPHVFIGIDWLGHAGRCKANKRDEMNSGG
jgi:hypothetical protein